MKKGKLTLKTEEMAGYANNWEDLVSHLRSSRDRTGQGT